MHDDTDSGSSVHNTLNSMDSFISLYYRIISYFQCWNSPKNSEALNLFSQPHTVQFFSDKCSLL